MPQRESETHPVDWILNKIADVPAANPRHELSWRLITTDRLDSLGSDSSRGTSEIFTKPDHTGIVGEILDLIHHFQNQSDQGVREKLIEIANVALELWSALRKDSCQVEFDFDPSTDNQREWYYVGEEWTSVPMVTNSLSEISIA